VILNTAPSVGAGDITLTGGAGTLEINTPLSVAFPLTLSATVDVVLNGAVATTGLNDLTILADTDLNGVGGVYVTAAGSVLAGRDLTIFGSSYDGTQVTLPANFAAGGIVIEDDGSNTQVGAAQDINLNQRTTVGSVATQLAGRVVSTSGGDITFVGDVELPDGTNTDDLAAVITQGGGDVQFGGTINGAHDLAINSDAGTITFTGQVGGVTPLAEVNILGGGSVQIMTGLNAEAFNAADILFAVDLLGPVNTTGAGDNFVVDSAALNVFAALNAGAGNIDLTVDNIDITSSVTGTGDLSIQSVTAGRTIGIN
jgi:hypothetical protein